MDKKNENVNVEQVMRTLRVVLDILEKQNVEYRVLGSAVFAAMYGQVHRKIGDIDLLIDKEKQDLFFSELERLGYVRAGGMFAFGRKYLALETLIHDDLLSVGYFFGDFEKSGNFRMGGKVISVFAESKSVVPVSYQLNGISFVGIPERAIAVGIMQSSSNPKRKKEVAFLKERGIEAFPTDGIHVRVFGLSFDWLYKAVMKFLNLIGILRIKFGLAYDPWRSKIG